MLLLTVLTVFAAAALGGAVAWARWDLELGAPAVAIWSAAIAAGALTLGIPASDLAGPLLIAFGAPLVVIDARRMVLPNPLTYGLLAAALALAAYEDRIASAALGAALGFAGLWAFGAAWERLRGVEALGLGDAKLFAGIGAALGPLALSEVAMVGAVATLVWSLVAARLHGRSVQGLDAAPFGPGLIFGAWAVWRFGPFLA